MADNNGVKDRLIQFADYQKTTYKKTKAAFERESGLSGGYIKNFKGNLGADKLEGILKAFPTLNKAWLLTGEGEMLNDGADQTPEEVPEKEESEEESDRVPLLPVEAIAGPLQAISESVYPRDCKMVVSPVPGADMAIPISGDSMLPDYRPGSILFIRKIVGGFFPWGNVMVIDTWDGVYVKTIYPCDDEGYIEAHSLNPKYPPFRIPVNAIYGIYRVLGSTFINTTY